MWTFQHRQTALNKLLKGIGLLALVALITFNTPAFSMGGTNRIFGRMDFMLKQLSDAHQLNDEEAQAWKVEIQRLRDKVDERIKENGGGINSLEDKDLLDEVNVSNKTLFDLYQEYKNGAH